MFSQNGELLGFQLRENVVIEQLRNTNFNLGILKKLIKTCAFINRMICYAETDEFNIYQFNEKEFHKKG